VASAAQQEAGGAEANFGAVAVDAWLSSVSFACLILRACRGPPRLALGSPIHDFMLPREKREW
jgi:hypothetical protein